MINKFWVTMFLLLSVFYFLYNCQLYDPFREAEYDIDSLPPTTLPGPDAGTDGGSVDPSSPPEPISTATPTPSPTPVPGLIEQWDNSGTTFDSTTYVDLGYDPSYDETDAFTVMAFIKVNSTYGNDKYFVSKGRNSGFEMHLRNNNTSIGFTIVGLSDESVNGSVDVTDNNWRHITGVYSGSSIILYVDGTVDGSDVSTGSVITDTQPIWIGGNSERTDDIYKWVGDVDSLRYYDYALTQGEIAAIAANLPKDLHVKETANNIPSGTMDYDIGILNLNSVSLVDITFTIYNYTSTNITLTGTPKITFAGTGYSLNSDASSPVPANGGTSIFQIRFEPGGAGTFPGTITIANDDPDENPYSFTIIGTSGYF